MDQFAKEIQIFNASQLGKEKFGNMIFGNTLLVVAACGIGWLPLKENSLREAIKISVPRELEKNIEAFNLGIELGKEREVQKERVLKDARSH